MATRSGLTRVRHYNTDDFSMKKEALAFAKKHARASDETYYSRTVDYNMLINDTATLIQVPFNTHLKIADRFSKFEMDQITSAAANYDANLDSNSNNNNNNNADMQRATRLSIKEMNLFEKLELLKNQSLYVIATQSIISKEGTQRAVAGVVGVFYDYASFALRLLNTTNYSSRKSTEQFKKPAHCYLPADNLQPPTNRPECDESKTQVKCGHSNDTIDCLLIDNNGYIILSEDLTFIGRHLRAYDPVMMARLVSVGVYHEINVTDYQSICVRQEQKPSSSSGASGGSLFSTHQARLFIQNLLIGFTHLWTIVLTISATLFDLTAAAHQVIQTSTMQQFQQPISSLLPNKTYLRPCDRVLTRYETRPGIGPVSSDLPEYYSTAKCNCPAWFVYEQVPETNLIMIITDTSSTCQSKCEANGYVEPAATAPVVTAAAVALDSAQADDSLNTQYNIIGSDEQKVCSMFERESKLYKKRLDSCFSHHPEEEHIKLCGAACKSAQTQWTLVTLAILFGCLFN